MDDEYTVEVDGEQYIINITAIEDHYELKVADRVYRVKLPDSATQAAPKRRKKRSQATSGVISSTIPGKIVTIEVSVGQVVAEGDICLVLEAMKMQNEIAAPTAGVVSEVNCASGDSIEANIPLIVIEAARKVEESTES